MRRAMRRHRAFLNALDTNALDNALDRNALDGNAPDEPAAAVRSDPLLRR
jgi:hypothetical protein